MNYINIISKLISLYNKHRPSHSDLLRSPLSLSHTGSLLISMYCVFRPFLSCFTCHDPWFQLPNSAIIPLVVWIHYREAENYTRNNQRSAIYFAVRSNYLTFFQYLPILRLILFLNGQCLHTCMCIIPSMWFCLQSMDADLSSTSVLASLTL